MTIKIYENDQIYVRPFVKSDITERYLEWFQDQEVCKYNSHGKMSNKPTLAINNNMDDSIGWAVISKYSVHAGTTYYSDHLIGKVKLEINWINRNAEFTCIFGEKEFWGKGYCTQVLKWIIDHSLNKLNLHKIWLGTAESNTGMLKAADKAGMNCEACLHSEVFLNGKFENVLRWGIFKDK